MSGLTDKKNTELLGKNNITEDGSKQMTDTYDLKRFNDIFSSQEAAFTSGDQRKNDMDKRDVSSLSPTPDYNDGGGQILTPTQGRLMENNLEN